MPEDLRDPIDAAGDLDVGEPARPLAPAALEQQELERPHGNRGDGLDVGERAALQALVAERERLIPRARAGDDLEQGHARLRGILRVRRLGVVNHHVGVEAIRFQERQAADRGKARQERAGRVLVHPVGDRSRRDGQRHEAEERERPEDVPGLAGARLFVRLGHVRRSFRASGFRVAGMPLPIAQMSFARQIEVVVAQGACPALPSHAAGHRSPVQPRCRVVGVTIIDFHPCQRDDADAPTPTSNYAGWGPGQGGRPALRRLQQRRG